MTVVIEHNGVDMRMTIEELDQYIQKLDRAALLRLVMLFARQNRLIDDQLRLSDAEVTL